MGSMPATLLLATTMTFLLYTVFSCAEGKVKTNGFPMYAIGPAIGSPEIAKSPEPFVHPRLLFVAADLPNLRQLILDPASTLGWKDGDRFDAPVTGAGGFIRLRALLEDNFYGSSDYLKYYNTMIVDNSTPGDIDVSPNGLKKRFGTVKLHGSNVADSSFGHTHLYGKLAGAAFVGLITENGGNFNLKELGKVLGATCKHHNAIWTRTDPRTFGFFHDTAPDLGLAYDWLYNEMNNADRGYCRELIGKMTGNGRREFGAQYLGFMWEGYNSNWIGWHETIVLLAASIERETKDWNPSWLSECYEVQSKYFQVESSEGGFAREGMGYHILSMNGALPTSVVVSRSQPNIFRKKETRDALYRMLLYRVYSAAPWIDQGQPRDDRTLDAFTHGDQPGTHRPRWATVLNKYYPNDPLVAWAYRTSDRHVYSIEPLMSAVFTSKGNPEGKHKTLEEVARTKRLPVNYFCRDRGEMIVRDHWGPDATVFDFDVKMNALGLGHNHADRNSFYLYSRGRAWIIDNRHGDVESEAHQTITIDGVGQGGGRGRGGINTFPGMPGIFVEYSEGTNAGVEWVSGSGDAKPAYDFTASCRSEAFVQGYDCIDSPYTRKDFSYPPAPYLNLPKLDGYPGDWMEDRRAGSGMHRKIMSFNPVSHAFRTTLFAKTTSSGTSAPFIIIVDDIKKDGREHKYEFILNLPWAENRGESWQYRHELENVVLDQAATAKLDSSKEVILKDTRDPSNRGPRLLVRVLHVRGASNASLKYKHKTTIELRRAMGGIATARHLVVETRVVAPDYRIFIYPHEAGDQLPKTAVSNDGTRITVFIPRGETTTWILKKSSDGMTRILPAEGHHEANSDTEFDPKPSVVRTTAAPESTFATPPVSKASVTTVSPSSTESSKIAVDEWAAENVDEKAENSIGNGEGNENAPSTGEKSVASTTKTGVTAIATSTMLASTIPPVSNSSLEVATISPAKAPNLVPLSPQRVTTQKPSTVAFTTASTSADGRPRTANPGGSPRGPDGQRKKLANATSSLQVHFYASESASPEDGNMASCSHEGQVVVIGN